MDRRLVLAGVLFVVAGPLAICVHRSVVREDPAQPRGVEGIVLRPDGRPAESACVRLSGISVSTDGHGAFRLPRADDDILDEDALVASLEGFQTFVQRRFGKFLRRASDRELRSLVLRLGPEALSIEGSVLDARTQAPLSGWTVEIVDGTEIVGDASPPDLAEHQAAGSQLTVTDSIGRFRVRGLYVRGYRLRAYDPKSLRSVRGGPFEAGREDVVLSVDPVDVLPRVSGRVVSRNGRPVAAIGVFLDFAVWRASGGRGHWIQGPSSTSNDEGRFVLENVPRNDIQLAVTGDDVMPARFDLGPGGDLEDLTLHVVRRCHLSLSVERPIPPSAWVEVFDAAGGPLDIYTFGPSVWMSGRKRGLAQGGPERFSVSEDARSLRIFTGTEKHPELLVEVPLSLLEPVGVMQVDVRLPKR